MACSSKNSVRYFIGGHVFVVNGNDSVECVRNMVGFDVFEIDENEKRDEIEPWIVNLDEELFSIIPYNKVYEVESDGITSMFGLRGGVPTFVMRCDERNVHFTMEYRDGQIFGTSLADADAMRFALWFAFNLFGSEVGAYGVHTSCVVYENQAVMFLGESGTGKSTHTRLWYNNFDGAFLLNDDSPIVSTESGSPVVYGSPWSGKTPCYKTQSYPLKAIVRLAQAPENKMRRLSPLESITALFPSFPPAFAKVEELNGKMLDSVSEILMQVPVYKLDCLPNVEAAELSRKTIFGK